MFNWQKRGTTMCKKLLFRTQGTGQKTLWPSRASNTISKYKTENQQ